MHLTLTVNQVMARRCANKGGKPRLAPVVRHSQQSVPTSLIGINRQQEQAARMAPIEISSRHTLLRCTAVARDLCTWNVETGFFLKRTSILAVAIVSRRFEFPPTISNISYFLYSHFVSSSFDDRSDTFDVTEFPCL